jgi:hypothetical protein
MLVTVVGRRGVEKKVEEREDRRGEVLGRWFRVELSRALAFYCDCIIKL